MNNKVLSDQELGFLQEFVKEVLVVCGNDLESITYGLDDKALSAGEILGLGHTEMREILERG